MADELVDANSVIANSARGYRNLLNFNTMGISASMLTSNTTARHAAQAPNFDDYCAPPRAITPRRAINNRTRSFRSRTPIRLHEEDSDVELVRSQRPPRVVSLPNPVVDFIDLSESTSEDLAELQHPPLPISNFVDLCSPARITHRRQMNNHRISQLRSQIRTEVRSARRQICDHVSFLNALPTFNDEIITPSSSRSSSNEQFEVLSAPTSPKRRAREADVLSVIGELEDSSSGAPPDILKCPVCMESAHRKKPTSTPCGHVFCRRCITQAARLTRKCPLCNAKIKEKSLLRLFV